MAKFIQTALVAALVAVCCADPARLSNLRQSRFSARQELPEVIEAQTPYPPAGIVPEVRFELPTEEAVAVEPDNTYLPPDNVGGVPAKSYGPPEADNDDEDIADVEAEPEVEQPKQPEGLEQEPINDEAENNEIENPQSERLVLRRLSNRRSARLQVRPIAPARSQRLIAQPIPVRSQRLVAQPIYFADGRLFTLSPQFLRV